MTYEEEFEIGKKIGKEKATREIAKRLLELGVDSLVVANTTGLTKVQIEELKKSL